MQIKLIILALLLSSAGLAQDCYWQQEAHYQIDVELNDENNILSGSENLNYINHSPDILNEVYLHLYWNAFQPNSMMDVRSRNILDPDSRVGDRIFHLKPEEMGYTKIKKAWINGTEIVHETIGTILKLSDFSIEPLESVMIRIEFETQVPVQIRRSGRDNKQGISYTMTQWYPKVAAYDQHGWHIDQYVGREFYGEWGSFDVCITMDSSYVLAGTGVLQNQSQLSQAFGYTNEDNTLDTTRYTSDLAKNTWHFRADLVHDFAWAADPDFTHQIVDIENGKSLHFFYQEADNENKGWEKLMTDMPKAFALAVEKFGDYPYEQYAFIQGGDGGMEYPMCTMIKGSSRGTAIHELMHSWYQGMLATNELWHEWMDEGFTVWASGEIEHILNNKKGSVNHTGSRKNYQRLVDNALEEPICNHADMYKTNFGYGVSAYSKGALFLENLAYIIGRDQLYNTLKVYHQLWAFKHPEPKDFMRVAEQVSGMNLDHFWIDWTKTIKHIDYGFRSIAWNADGKVSLILERVGEMAMPLELIVEKKTGEKILYYFPLLQTYGRKSDFHYVDQVNQYQPLPWTHPVMTFDINENLGDISNIQIFPTENIPDVERIDNAIDFKDLDLDLKEANYQIEPKTVVEIKVEKIKEKGKKKKKIKKRIETKVLKYKLVD
ncbi:MAG: M1 family metallopeptidase [Flavobacteriales bacterium]